MPLPLPSLYTDRQRHCPGQRYASVPGHRTGQHNADGHSFGDIVECYGQHEFGRAFEFRLQPLILVGIDVQVRYYAVQQQQECHSAQKTSCRGQPCCHLLPFGDVDRRYEQRPHRGGHHHARGESEKQFLYAWRYLVLEQEYHCGTERRAGKWNQEPYQCIHHIHSVFGFSKILKQFEIRAIFFGSRPKRVIFVAGQEILLNEGDR